MKKLLVGAGIMLYNEKSLLRLENRPFELYRKRYVRFLREPKEVLLKEYFFDHFGRVLDLNAPKTYNEKLQWLKINWNDERAPLFTDKYEVKFIVESFTKNLKVIPTIQCYNSAEDIDFSKLPRECVIKATHGSGFNLFISNISSIDKERVINVFKQILAINYGAVKLEWNYIPIQPRIIVEPLIQCSCSLPRDYKFYCFHGQVKFVEILNACDWHNDHEPIEMIVNREFKKMNFSYSFRNELIIQKPPIFDDMVRIAEQISQPFPHVRVDLYNFGDDEIYWGECTFFPSSGYGKFSPRVYDEKIGGYLDINRIII